MHDTGYLIQALVLLAAAALFVPIFKRIGLGSVLGYLAAGLAIGPAGAGLITDLGSVQQISELGVVMLLFLVGLELNPQRLWSLRRSIFGLGTLQVVFSIVLAALASRLLGLNWNAAIVIGMAVSMSSTAVALQILEERNLGATPAGQSAFAVALFQDLAVIPLLLLLSLLAPEGTHREEFSGRNLLIALGMIGVMVVAGRLALRPLLRWIASIGMREIFIAFALLLIVGSAWLTQSVGLSLALGSFIAGVLLADSEYRMELEVDIDPFKGLLLGLFFMAVGMAINLEVVRQSPFLVLGLALGAVALKVALLAALAWYSRLCREDGWVFALSISQVGEFAFVLLGQAQTDRILAPEQAALANAAVAVSMLTTPLLFLFFDRFVAPRYNRKRQRAADVIEERNEIIIAGVGRFGQIVVRLLTAKKYKLTIIDHDPNQIELTARFGWRTYYGDASRPDVLEAAGIEHARLCVLAMDDPAAVQATARYIREHYPKVHLIARAKNRTDARALALIGVPAVRETFGSALDAARQSLEALGMAHEEAVRVAAQFRAHDELMFAKQVEAWNDQEKLIALNDQGRNDLLRLLEEEADQGNTPIDPTPGASASPGSSLSAGSIPAATSAPESR